MKHSGSRNPKSWKDPQGAAITQRSKAQAIALLNEHMKGVKDAASFAAVAKAHSDCGSAKDGGDLNWFKRGMMQKPFEDASFALKVGETSGVVDTDSGLHIIKRLA